MIYVVLNGIWEMHCEESFNDWPPDPFTIIAGGAWGADYIASEWAREQPGVTLELHPANWGEHGKAAGPIRNQQMLDEGKPNMVLAFSDHPTTKGTADMIKRAKKAGVVVWQIGHP
jgi:YspA, cpYpsA-related SLOG family